LRLVLSFVVGSLALCACGSGHEPTGGVGPVGSTRPASHDPPLATGSLSVTDDEPYAAKRTACRYRRGALPAETFGPSIAGAELPIDTIVIVSQENRSFDEYFGQLPEAGQPDVDVENPQVVLRSGKGVPFTPFHESELCTGDPLHDWNSMHLDWDRGKNDGFVRVNPTLGGGALGYFDQGDLGFYYGLATTYAISDAYFAAVLGPTWTNRDYLYAGTSLGRLVNGESLPADQPTIFTRLADADVSFGVYSNAPPGVVTAGCPGPYSHETEQFCDQIPGGAKDLAAFRAAAAAGTLPHVSWIYAGNDEHPPADIQQGEADVQLFFDAFAASPQWSKGAFILTYDENGGFYDHVAPPAACLPDEVRPDLTAGDLPGAFNRYGFRLPFILASPYAKPHFVSHAVNSHTSVLRFLELLFDLPACSDRDANADPLLDFFDFSHPSFPKAAVFPPVIVANPSRRGC